MLEKIENNEDFDIFTNNLSNTLDFKSSEEKNQIEILENSINVLEIEKSPKTHLEKIDEESE